MITARRARTARFLRDERGGSLVEFALTMPLVFALALGAFTGGATYTQKIALVDSVREAARYGASLKVPAGASGLSQWEALVRDRVVALSSGAVPPSGVCVGLVLPTGGTTCGVSDPVGASAESTTRVVKVSAQRSGQIEFLFLTLRPTLTAKLSARYERDTG